MKLTLETEEYITNKLFQYVKSYAYLDWINKFVSYWIPQELQDGYSGTDVKEDVLTVLLSVLSYEWQHRIVLSGIGYSNDSRQRSHKLKNSDNITLW